MDPLILTTDNICAYSGMAGDSATPTADAPHLAGRHGNAEHLDTSVFAFERAGQGGPSLRQPKLWERSG